MNDRIPKIIARLRCNIAIFALPQERGRPRKYGNRLGNACTLALTYHDRAQNYSVYLYGKTRMILALDEVVMLKTLGCKVRIVRVFNKSRWVAL